MSYSDNLTDRRKEYLKYVAECEPVEWGLPPFPKQVAEACYKNGWIEFDMYVPEHLAELGFVSQEEAQEARRKDAVFSSPNVRLSIAGLELMRQAGMPEAERAYDNEVLREASRRFATERMLRDGRIKQRKRSQAQKEKADG